MLWMCDENVEIKSHVIEVIKSEKRIILWEHAEPNPAARCRGIL